jgi:hypothetical protein
MPRPREVDSKEIMTWLLAGDPAIAWQTERDLLMLPTRRYERTRRRVAERGWGARLLGERSRVPPQHERAGSNGCASFDARQRLNAFSSASDLAPCAIAHEVHAEVRHLSSPSLCASWPAPCTG